jgi:hypothetical protein
MSCSIVILQELAHWLLPRDGVVNSFVIEANGKVTDLCR